MAEEQPRKISRRELLKGAGMAGAAAMLPVVTLPAAAPASQAPAPALPAPRGAAVAAPHLPRAPLENLTAAEAEVLEAIVARLIPSDEYGPGAVEAGAVNYIDRALGGALWGSRDEYRAGLAAFDLYCRRSRGAPFAELSATDQDSALIDAETGAATGAGTGFPGSSAAFFNMVKSHTWQGTFGDPYYGGNVNFVGWQLIGYPGIRTAVTGTVQEQLEAGELEPSDRSAYDFEVFNKATARARSQGGAHHGD